MVLTRSGLGLLLGLLLWGGSSGEVNAQSGKVFSKIFSRFAPPAPPLPSGNLGKMSPGRPVLPVPHSGSPLPSRSAPGNYNSLLPAAAVHALEQQRRQSTATPSSSPRVHSRSRSLVDLVILIVTVVSLSGWGLCKFFARRTV